MTYRDELKEDKPLEWLLRHADEVAAKSIRDLELMYVQLCEHKPGKRWYNLIQHVALRHRPGLEPIIITGVNYGRVVDAVMREYPETIKLFAHADIRCAGKPSVISNIDQTDRCNSKKTSKQKEN